MNSDHSDRGAALAMSGLESSFRDLLRPEICSSHLRLTPGTRIARRYTIESLIGKGGMGAVYSATDDQRRERVAVKVMSPALLGDRLAHARFQVEAKIAGDLSHPGIVNVFDLQRDGDHEFLIMELLDGRTLRDEMAERKRNSQEFFTVQEAKEIVLKLCAALDYAHLYTVHRDVKPENIWIGRDGAVKLMDFGLARLLLDRSSAVPPASASGPTMGTPYYMAPEQLTGSRDVDVRADQYSVAVVLYELLTGEVPAGMAAPLEEFRDDISPALSRAVIRALASQPGKRYGTIREFAEAIRLERDEVFWRPQSAPGLTLFSIAVAFVSFLAFAGVQGVLEWSRRHASEATARRQASAELLREAPVAHAGVRSKLGEVERLWRSYLDISVTTKQAESNSIDWEPRVAAALSNYLDGNFASARDASDRLHAELTQWHVTFLDKTTESVRRDREDWLSLFSDPVLVPDLEPFGHPEHFLTNGIELSATGRFREAWTNLAESGRVYRSWKQSVLELNQRTARFLETFPFREHVSTNRMGMPFISLGNLGIQGVTGLGNMYVCLWETRVMDYALFTRHAPGMRERTQFGSSWTNAALFQSPVHPVSGVSWEDAKRFAIWLGFFCRDILREPSTEYSLMSRRDWELLSQALPQFETNKENLACFEVLGVYFNASNWPPPSDSYSWGADQYIKPADYVLPVASGKPNAFGMFDLNGNVWEWLNARHTLSNQIFRETDAPVLVGGGWFGQQFDYSPELFDRPELRPIGRTEGIGFRVMHDRWR